MKSKIEVVANVIVIAFAVVVRKTLSVISIAALYMTLAQAAQAGAEWQIWGYETPNTRNAAHEHIITKPNVGSLKVKRVFTTAGDVSATPTWTAKRSISKKSRLVLAVLPGFYEGVN